MKILIRSSMLYIFIASILLTASAQNRNMIWMLDSKFSDNLSQGLDFSNGSLVMFTEDGRSEFYLSNASICDTNGQLLFYSNGNLIKNRNFDSLDNTFGFNPGYATDEYPDGLPIPQGAIVIPKPNKPEQYFLFHESADEIFPLTGYDAQPLELRYSLIDITLDNSMGGIVVGSKTKPIIIDTLTLGRLNACKHANGRDWWLVCHEYYTNKYYKLLITPDTILGPFQQYIGTPILYDIFGYAVFTPDGNWYANLSPEQSVDLMKFDRCTGEFSNQIHLEIPDSSLLLSCMFSPNNRFLYVASYIHIFQYDLLANDIPNSVITVATYDYDSQPGLARWFTLMQLAPDNKIYISTYNSTAFLHIIDDPDSLGLNCKVIQSGVSLLSYNNASIPNYPNYDLGPLQGSPCDTLFSSTAQHQTNAISFRISPNPSSDWINIVYETDYEIVATISDAFGRELKSFSLYPWFRNRIVHVDDLPDGVYLLTLNSQSWKQTMKLIVAN
ncbi:MAG TPA: T9SS type A sorting domain-containing protein [Saprospiraceae bacterium]|nr:T9SS type A sorting domain-containing protein [Saprospiraceae bacterium]